MSSITPGDIINFANNEVCTDFPDPTGCLAVFLKAIPTDLLSEAVSFTDEIVSAAQGPIKSLQDQVNQVNDKILEVTQALELKNALLSTLDRLVLEADTFLSEGIPCAELTFLRQLWSGLRTTTATALDRLNKIREDLNAQLQFINAGQQVLDCANSNFERVKGVLDTVSTGGIGG